MVIEGDYRIESGFRAGHALLSYRPDGIYVANHLMTIGLLKAAEEMGLRCPEDFGLVSFDDYPWLGVFRPRLTTVELPKHQLGSEAAELLIRRISGIAALPWSKSCSRNFAFANLVGSRSKFLVSSLGRQARQSSKSVLFAKRSDVITLLYRAN